MTRLYQDLDWWEAGVHQTLSVAVAALQAGTKLDSLTLAHVSPILLDPQSWEEEGTIEWPVLETLVQPIRRFRLFINVEPLEDKSGEAHSRDPTIFSVRTQCELAFAEGHLYKVMSSASDLRVLKLGLPRWPAYDEQEAVYYYDDDQAPKRFSRLELVPQDIGFPKLYELSLSCCEVEAEYLIDLCLRHKSTLRRLDLQDISLCDFEDDWQSVLTQLSKLIPQLRRIRLRGAFLVENEPEIHFEYAASEFRRIAPYRDAMETLVPRRGRASDGRHEDTARPG